MIEKTYKITSYDVFPNGEMRLSSLQKYMQQVAREDCDAYGATYPKMRESGMVFVVTKLCIEMNEVISIGDELRITAINNRIVRTSFYREFLFYIGERQVGAATTIWVLIDFVNRRVLRPNELVFEIPEMNLPIESRPIRRSIWQSAYNDVVVSKHIVRLSELDENNHMNNAEYADLIYDYTPNDTLRGLKKCEIHFMGEAGLGDELDVYYCAVEGGYAVGAYNRTADKMCFEAEIEFLRKEEK